MAATSQIARVPLAELREFIDAAEEIRQEGAAAEIPGDPGWVPGDAFNALEPRTEDRFQLALDALKFKVDGL